MMFNDVRRKWDSLQSDIACHSFLFHHACTFNDFMLVRFLIHSGLVNQYIEDQLNNSVFYENIPIIPYLLSQTPRKRKAYCKNPRIEKLLILNGWDCIKDERNRTLYQQFHMLCKHIRMILVFKKRQVKTMLHLDRFLLYQLALVIWAERYSL